MHQLCALCGVDQHELLPCKTILLEHFITTYPKAAEAAEKLRAAKIAAARHRAANAQRLAAAKIAASEAVAAVAAVAAAAVAAVAARYAE